MTFCCLPQRPVTVPWQVASGKLGSTPRKVRDIFLLLPVSPDLTGASENDPTGLSVLRRQLTELPLLQKIRAIFSWGQIPQCPLGLVTLKDSIQSTNDPGDHCWGQFLFVYCMRVLYMCMMCPSISIWPFVKVSLCAEGPGLRMKTAGLQSKLNAFFPLVSETHGFLKDTPLL